MQRYTHRPRSIVKSITLTKLAKTVLQADTASSRANLQNKKVDHILTYLL